eukprot:scaffold8374_cov175-Amphora_coffeaeformis.AAC.72
MLPTNQPEVLQIDDETAALSFSHSTPTNDSAVGVANNETTAPSSPTTAAEIPNLGTFLARYVTDKGIPDEDLVVQAVTTGFGYLAPCEPNVIKENVSDAFPVFIPEDVVDERRRNGTTTLIEHWRRVLLHHQGTPPCLLLNKRWKNSKKASELHTRIR